MDKPESKKIMVSLPNTAMSVFQPSVELQGWRNWGCSVWRRGGWGETLLLSTATWKEVVVRQALVSSPR